MKTCTDKEKELIELIKASPDCIIDEDYVKMGELMDCIRKGHDTESGD